MELKEQLDFLQYKTLVASINDVVFQTDASGNWVFLNESWSRIMGYPVRDSIDKPFYSFLHPDDVAKNAKLFEPMMSGKKQFCSHEIRYLTKTGAVSWTKVFAMLVKDELGNIIGTQGTLQDINLDIQNRETRLKAEVLILEALEKQRELNLLKSSFVSLASHEFRTPLAVIRTSIELSAIHIEKHHIELPYVMKHVKTITDEVDKLSDLIEKVLTLGLIDSKSFICKLEEVDLVHLARETLASLDKIQLDKRTVELLVSGKIRHVMADPLLLANAITNIVSNAFKYSPDRPGPRLEVVFEEAGYKIIITDFGIGIPEEAQGKVAQAFFRADNVSAIKGTGLGIFIAKKFISMHFGTLTFKTIPTQGTVFTIAMNDESK